MSTGRSKQKGMKTPSELKRATPDWAAMNCGFSAEQRAAFNAFHSRLYELASDALNDLSGHVEFEKHQEGHPATRACENVRNLMELIYTIPWMEG